MRSLALVCVLWVSCAGAQEKLLGRIGYIQSHMNPQVIQEFNKAWQAAGLGIRNTERAVLIFRKTDGSLVAEGQGSTNQFASLSVRWNPAAIAIVHTHRNNDGAEPSPPDKEVANKLGVPIFTITSRGMYVYDPEMKRVVKMQDGLDWLDASKWTTDHSPVIAPHGQSIDQKADSSAGASTEHRRQEAQESGDPLQLKTRQTRLGSFLGQSMTEPEKNSRRHGSSLAVAPLLSRQWFSCITVRMVL